MFENHPSPLLVLPETFALSRLGCILWTACLLMPRTAASWTHDQIATSAFSTCEASSISSRRCHATTTSRLWWCLFGEDLFGPAEGSVGGGEADGGEGEDYGVQDFCL
jgi:hypothetical protein